MARLAQSGFDPLSHTCRFMLTEEAHHMFVGETGVGRIPYWFSASDLSTVAVR
jgi:benzoyl-CoA 2,3-epoxidase subunit B